MIPIVTFTFELWPPKSIGFTMVNMCAKFNEEAQNGLVCVWFTAYFHTCTLWPWPLTSKMNRVHPLTMINISAKLDAEIHNGLFSLLRQEYPPILTSGEMLSYPGGWDKPIPEVIHLWRHRTSTPNNLEKSRLGYVLIIFCTFLGKNKKNNQTSHWGRDSGIPSSCLRFATSTTRQASSWIANLRHSEGIPSSLPQCGVRFY